MRRRSAAGTGIAVLAVLIAYSWLIEPRTISITRVVISEGELARVGSGRRVALLSDMHFGDVHGPDADQVVRLLAAIKPDILLLAGDYVEWGGRARAYDRALDFLSRLGAPQGVFAVLGDADATYSRRSCDFCHEPGSGRPTRRHRVAFLRDEQRTVETSGGSFRIIGLDPEARSPRSAEVARMLGEAGPAIVLAHASTVFGELPTGRDVLVLSGDTHGGQVWIPTWLWRLGRFKPDPEHPAGLYREGNKTLYVTRGVGTSHVPLRLGVPPELVVIDFGPR